MRRTLPVLVAGLVAAVLGIVGLAGIASAVSTTPDQAAKQEINRLKKTADTGGSAALEAPGPQQYGSR